MWDGGQIDLLFARLRQHVFKIVTQQSVDNSFYSTIEFNLSAIILEQASIYQLVDYSLTYFTKAWPTRKNYDANLTFNFRVDIF